MVIRTNNSLYQKNTSGSREEKTKKELVVFVEPVAEFSGLEGKMGPFEKGQVANLPKEIAKILIDDKKCEVVKG